MLIRAAIGLFVQSSAIPSIHLLDRDSQRILLFGTFTQLSRLLATKKS